MCLRKYFVQRCFDSVIIPGKFEFVDLLIEIGVRQSSICESKSIKFNWILSLLLLSTTGNVSGI